MQHQPIPHGTPLASLLVTAVIIATACQGTHTAARQISFQGDIQPILTQQCADCHPTAYPYLNLQPGSSYNQLVGVSPPNAPSYVRVLPGRPDLSYLLIHPTDPSRKHLLTRSQRQLIVQWILQGARDN